MKLVKVIENNLFDAGKFSIDLCMGEEQESFIMSKTGKPCGKAVFKVSLETIEKPSKKTWE